ncbi:MAG: peptidoglycan bridge formation glycyltransferase FemA/FemB family protein [Patescibacteria group bacterium]
MEITDQQQWDQFIINQGSQFLQSWDWAELQKTLGRQIWRLGVLENNQLVAAALIIKYSLPLGKNYLYCPRGPLVTSEKYSDRILTEIKAIAQQEKSIFIKLEPTTPLHTAYRILHTKNIQPHQTLIIDLTRPTEEIFSSFHPKTRYNIRLAEKKGLAIRESKTDTDLETFWQLLQKTYNKQGIKTHPKDYYQKLLTIQAIHESPLTAHLYLAEYQNKTIAAHLCYTYGDTFTYAHGGSDYDYHQLMAPHLLQWHQIQTAKNAGFKNYDFWGIDEKRWPGVTRFKLGFNGQTINYPGTFDLPIDKLWYSLYQLGKRILK